MRWRVLLIIGMLAIELLSSYAEAHPLTPGWTRWVKDALEQDRLASLHEVPYLYPIHLLPNRTLETAKSPWPAPFKGGNHIWISPELRADTDQSPWTLPAVSGSFSFGESKVRLLGAIELSQRKSTDLTARNLNPWRGDFVLRTDHMGLWAEPLPGLTAFLGRTALQWGPGYWGTLGISAASPPLDLVLMHYRWPRWRGIQIHSSLFATRLDPLWHLTPRYLAQRYYMGHRVEGWYGPRFGLGVSEFVLYAGEAPYWEWMYFNPIMPYYVSQYNADRDDNILVTGDFWFRVRSGMAIYGELLVDDYQYARSDSPNALAGMIGLHATDAKGNDWRFEYTRLNRWVYTHRISQQQYTHYGVPLGQPLGPDGDELRFRWMRWLRRDTQIALGYQFQREGEATPADRFLGEEHWRIPFPSGVVTRRHALQVQFLREPWRGWQWDGSYRLVVERNGGHRSGNQTLQHEWSASVIYRFEISGGGILAPVRRQ